ncbi:mediator of RNA polymerase II transcription subunit 4 isoform X1 [Centruroides vittatus]|uniref:mediator of RNA polymerase II transcription subunit 4 isoform X1 n=1 Tax=Centruroides vittatus TaxID=120091 RepID=UPI00350FBC47
MAHRQEEPILISTRQRLLQLVDDIEVVTKELLENILQPKTQKLSATEHARLAELLVAKDRELKVAFGIAAVQAEIQEKMNALQLEVEKQDQDIQQLQKHLKEAEYMLVVALYQARQKIEAIEKAKERSVSSEELIKYAHRISASNAVAAPHNWQQGDPRRPYPTDIEMRLGYLGRLSDLPTTISGSMLQQTNLGDMSTSRGPHGEQTSSTQAGTFSWQPPNDIKANIGAASNHNSVTMDTKGHNKENEDVEVMSTDSSSSSSSDSQ